MCSKCREVSLVQRSSLQRSSLAEVLTLTLPIQGKKVRGGRTIGAVSGPDTNKPLTNATVAQAGWEVAIQAATCASRNEI